MRNSESSRFVVTSMPKTGWREPVRATDDLLKLPRGRPLKPTEKLQEEEPAVAVSDVEDGASVAAEDEASITKTDILQAEKGVMEAEVDVHITESNARSREAQIVSPDGTSEQAEEFDADVEDDTAVSERSAALHDARVSIEDEEQISSIDAEGELDDEELLAGEERETEHDDQDVDGTIFGQASASSNAHSGRKSIHQAKSLREGTEVIRPHPTDLSKSIVTYRYTNSTGHIYVQTTEIPEVVRAPANPVGEASSIIVPDVEASKIPRTKKGSPWVPVPGTSQCEWTRTKGGQQQIWRVNIFFRRLDRDTHAYRDMYINTNMLNNVDPNDKTYRTAYNKWILQFARRRDATYTQKVARVHWSVAERRALYTGINTFCAKFDIQRFGFTEECKLSTRQLQLLADRVNAVPNPARTAPRGVDAVRGQIISAHDKAQPKNKAVFDLMARAVALRARIASGEVVSRAERKPHAAIALSEFPVDVPAAVDRSAAPGSKKRKRVVTVEETDDEPSSSELSTPPASDVDEDDGVSEDTWMTTEEDIQPGESEEGNWSDTSEEVLPGENEDEWAEVEEVESSPPAKRLHTT